MSNDKLVDTLMKKDLEEIYRKNHKEMLVKHPDQKEILDGMLKVKLKKIGIVDAD